MATIPGTSGNNTQNDTVGTSDFYDMLAGNDTVYAGGGDDTIFGGTDNDRLFGGTGNDYISGDAGTDSIEGGDGNDTLIGGAGADTIYGGAGDDWFIDVIAGDGNDIYYGGDGVDTMDYSSSGVAVSVTLTSGNATVNPPGFNNTDSLFGFENIIGSQSNDTITGDDGANFLSGQGGADRLYGGGGNDTIEGGAGADSLFGGDGTDTATYATSTSAVQVTLNGSTNTGGHAAGDTLTGFENLTGSFYNDALTGTATNNVIDGAEGNDTINALGGNDTVYGGTGNDVIDGGTGNDLIYAGPDSGTTGTGAPIGQQFNWTDYSDEQNLADGVVQNTGAINVEVSFSGGRSGSTISAETTGTTSGGDERQFPIYVGSGEPFNPNSSAELFRLGAGTRTQVEFEFSASDSAYLDEVQNVQFRISDIDLSGFTDSVTVRAYDADGNEIPVTLTETSASLTVSGNTVTATGGAVNPNDVAGSVLVTIPGPVARIVIEYTDLNDANQAIRVSDVHFEAVPTVDNDSVLGGVGDDSIFGGIGNDTLDGGADNDQLFGGSGNDLLFGGTGHDTIDGGSGNDTIDGGAGNDSLFGGEGNDSIAFGSGDDTVYGGAGDDFIDDVVGGTEAGANLLYGGDGNDTIWAGDGSDTVYGDAGNDILNGESGDDSIFGGTGNDTIYGGDGADYTDGGADRDAIYGGTGNDTIIGGADTDSLYGGDGNDTFIIGLADTFSDTLTPEIIDGGGTEVGPNVAGDYDVIDLTAYGWDRVVIVPSGPEAGTIYIYSDSTETVLIGIIQYSEIEEIIPCFTPGTMILTDGGEVAVEALRVGDLVMTRDNGLQPLRWIGQRKLSALDLQADPDLQPVRIAKGAFSGAGPDRTLLVSPQHRVLIEGARAELLFGEAEVLVPAKHLVGQADVTRALPAEGVTYIHILFDRHEIVQSDGIWTESFQPAERTLSAMEADTRAEVLALFPQLEQSDDTFEGARLSLKAHEARVLFAAE